MLETLLSEEQRRKLNPSTKAQKGKKLGKCVLCSERVRTNQRYLTASEGYTHKECLK